MRPRVFPAEDVDPPAASRRQAQAASMRPRVFPAEDARAPAMWSGSSRRFNEAAGIPRGRLLRAGPILHHVEHASMRPRVFPAEDRVEVQERIPAGLASMRPRVFPAEDRSSP